MPRRADPKQIAKLVQVQHVRRAAADMALAAAREDEARTMSLRDEARASASLAAADWSCFLAKPGFAPDYIQALAGRLLVRELTVTAATERYQNAADVHVRRQQDWRLSEALVRLSEASLDRAKRDAGRVREEKRLSELSDRVTYKWMRS